MLIYAAIQGIPIPYTANVDGAKYHTRVFRIINDGQCIYYISF